jgi:hypothetical protein
MTCAILTLIPTAQGKGAWPVPKEAPNCRWQKIDASQPPLLTFKERSMPSASVDKVIMDNYRILTCAQIASLIGKTRGYVKVRAQRLGIRLDPSALSERRSQTMKEVRIEKLGYKEKRSSLHLSFLQQHLRYFSQYPERKHCASIYEEAVKSGKLKRLPCIICEDPKSDGHHIDYSKPLEVIWLCRKHHHEAHKKLRQR